MCKLIFELKQIIFSTFSPAGMRISEEKKKNLQIRYKTFEKSDVFLSISKCKKINDFFGNFD